MTIAIRTADPAAPADDAGGQRPVRRVVAGAIVGNILEWYDFAVYGYFAAAIGQQFFPAADPTASLLAALGVFAAGFIARPLGGIVFGHVADRLGRRRALNASIALMAVPTFLIGVLPTHDRIGVLAPALLLLLRLLQGFSVGGEYATSIVYSVEHAPPGRRGLIASASGAGSIAGILIGSGLGALINTVLPAEAAAEWGWRIPFLLGIALGGVGFVLRRGALEEEAPPPRLPGAEPAPAPLLAALRAHPWMLLQVVAMCALVGVGFYLVFVYSVTYLSDVLHETVRDAFDINTASLVLLTLSYPLGAMLSDRVGRKPVLLASGLLVALLAWPLYRLMHSPDLATVLLAQLGLTLAIGMFISVVPVVLVEAFPRELRCSAVALTYNLAMALFGGLAPAAATWLIGRTGMDMMPAIMVIGAAVMSVAAVATLPETARRPLHGGP